jgi:hypothetical protein
MKVGRGCGGEGMIRQVAALSMSCYIVPKLPPGAYIAHSHAMPATVTHDVAASGAVRLRYHGVSTLWEVLVCVSVNQYPWCLYTIDGSS